MLNMTDGSLKLTRSPFKGQEASFLKNSGEILASAYELVEMVCLETVATGWALQRHSRDCRNGEGRNKSLRDEHLVRI